MITRTTHCQFAMSKVTSELGTECDCTVTPAKQFITVICNDYLRNESCLYLLQDWLTVFNSLLNFHFVAYYFLCND